MSRLHRFLAFALMGAGAVIAWLSGTCTWSFLQQATRSNDGSLPLVLLIGGVPTLFGVAAIVTGILLLRRPPSPPKGRRPDA